MAHNEWCGKPCSGCIDSCKLDESIPCSPDCENLLPDGGRDVINCREAECDVETSNCRHCGTKITIEHLGLPCLCESCMAEHCAQTNCLQCDYGKYPDCHWLDSKSNRLRKCRETNEEKWAKYLLYLKEWADAKSDPLFMGCCPVCYEEWLDNEWNDVRPLDVLSTSDRERIFREVERNYLIEDIKVQLDRDEVDKSGLSHDQILSDDDIISHILHLYRKCETYDWENMEYAVENGISDVLEARKEV